MPGALGYKVIVIADYLTCSEILPPAATDDKDCFAVTDWEIVDTTLRKKTVLLIFMLRLLAAENRTLIQTNLY